MSTGTARKCQMCAENDIDTAMFKPDEKAAPVCPRCDRIKCRCGAIVLDAKAIRCENCGADVTLKTFLRRQGR